MREFYEKYKCFFASVMVWGVLAHGTVLFNKIGFFDEMLYMFNVGATYTSGRWMLGITSEITRFLGGGYALQPADI